MANNQSRLSGILKKTEYILNKDCITFHKEHQKDLMKSIFESGYACGPEHDLYCKIIKHACLQILQELCDFIIQKYHTDALIIEKFSDSINNKLISKSEEMNGDIKSILTEYRIKNFCDKMYPLSDVNSAEKIKSFIASDFDDQKGLKPEDRFKAAKAKEIFYEGYNKWYSNYIDKNGQKSDKRLHAEPSDDSAEKYQKTIKLNAYANLPIYERELVIYWNSISNMVDDLNIDICSERIYVRRKDDGSYIPLIQTKINGDKIYKLAPNKTSKILPWTDAKFSEFKPNKISEILPWIDAKFSNSNTDVKKTSNYYYEITVSEDLFDAFTEDYCFRPSICKVVNTDPLFHLKEQKCTFYIEELGELQNKFTIINYFISLIIRKGLTNATLEIVEKDSKTKKTRPVYTLTSEQCKNLFSDLTAEQPHPDS